MILFRATNSSLPSVKLLKCGFGIIQTATITSRATRGAPACLPSAFPYQEKKFLFHHEFLDPTIVKVGQENAKIIVVEGPIGVGKSAFCKVLAEQFDMLYMPQPTMDETYILPNGYDLRQHDDELPESVRSYDHKNFCLEPNNKKAAWFQIFMLYHKFFQYLDAVCHILNTGQGIVMERSYFSDYVFMKAMLEQKYIAKDVASAYVEIKKNSSTFFMEPSLIIYLDIPVPVVQERIRTRNYSYEQNSPALTREYLTSLEKYWKKDYLVQARENSEILIYDWTDGGDVEVVIDDIEKIDFDIMRRDGRFRNWWLTRKMLYFLRTDFTNHRKQFIHYFEYPYHRVPDLYIIPQDYMHYNRVLESIPYGKYDVGYNPLVGDKIFNILFKSNTEMHRHLKPFLCYETTD